MAKGSIRRKRSHWLANLIKENNWTIGCEVGTGEGGNMKRILELTQGSNFQLILVAYYPIDSLLRKKQVKGDDYCKSTSAKNIFIQRQSMFKSRTRVIWKPSVEAVDEVDNHSLDFVFIDGNHSYQSCLEDIMCWYPKVKNDGLVCGHDYDLKRERLQGVIKAVNEYFDDNFSITSPEKDGIWDTVWYHWKKDQF